ncbi:MAG: T9SS type B sorting domain-containing protein [Bacteroidales bacterium]|nr:T9SS type B sorting domain-containing protein [Bacteroidales bacterium]
MPFSTGIRSLFIIGLLCACPIIRGQAYFTAQDTLCINDSVIIDNQSREAGTYFWNFCSGNLAYDPAGENLGNAGGLNGPAFIDFAGDEGNYYAFITNHLDPSITRYSYGNDFLSVPDAINMGRFGTAIPAHVQGIQVVQDGDSWYVFVVGGQREESRLVRLDFGSSLSNNAPLATNLGNIGDLDYPVDLYIDNIDGEWIGFTVNKNTNTLTRLTFPGGLENPPLGTNLGNPANFQSPCGILPVFEQGAWYIFVSNYDSHEISRLDFGYSLLNEPAGVSIGDSRYLQNPFDLTIVRDCERTYGFVLNRFNDIVRLEFNNGLGADPVFTSLGEAGGFYNPQGISDIFRVGDNLYAFVANIDNSTITRLYFEGCDNAIPSSSTERDPPTVRYNEPGTYNINLVIDEGLPQQENYCMNVVVLDSAHVNLGKDTLVPAGSSVVLSPDTVYTGYLWSTGSAEQEIEVYDAGIYTITVTNEYGCQASDDIEVILDIGIPNFLTPNGDGFNDTWSIPFLYNKPDAEIRVFDRFGNLLIYYSAGEGEWDGTSAGNPLPVGTYWYVIEVPGISKAYKGSVSIKR